VVRTSGKNGGKEDHGSEKNEKSTSPQPTGLKACQTKSFLQRFVQSDQLLASNPGSGFARISKRVGPKDCVLVRLLLRRCYPPAQTESTLSPVRVSSA
jgi:hypothetical protein